MNLFSKYFTVAKYSITDFKDECADLLKATMESGQDFIAEWSCTEEAISAEVKCVNGKLDVKVCVSVDDLLAILESEAVDYAAGSNFSCAVLDQWADACESIYCEHFCESVTEFEGDYEALIAILEELEAQASRNSVACYQSLVEYVRGEIELSRSTVVY